jgi:hypothetical protein
MELPKYAKGAIAFILFIAASHIWSAVTPVYKPPWTPWPPLVPIMKDFVVPFLVNFYRPVLIGASGLAIYWIWEGRRAGYILALILTVVAAGFGVLVVIFNAMAQQWSGLFTAAVSIAFPAVMALWYSYQGYRNHDFHS